MSKYWRIEDGQVCWRTPNADLRGYDYPMLVACLNERDEKIADLEKQLAEKDERIRNLNLEAQRYYEDAYCNDFQDKAKADFAIEQLEQLKYNIRLDNSDEETGDMPYVLDTNCLFEQIDNKIKELRGQK